MSTPAPFSNSPTLARFADDEWLWLAPAQGFDLELLEQLRRTLGDQALARLGVIRLPASFKLSVVIPAYNERASIRACLDRTLASPVPKEVIVVDDGSTDGTRDLLMELCDAGGNDVGDDSVGDHNLRILFHDRNRGKGAALRTGFAAATGDVVLVQDADLEYDPADWPTLLAPLVDGRADVVYGSRFLGGPARTHLFWHRVGNWLLTLASNMTTNLNLSDMETGYKAMRRAALEGIEISQNRFGVEPELTAKLARRRQRFYEVPISYAGRDYVQGKKIGWRDGVSALWCIARYAWWD